MKKHVRLIALLVVLLMTVALFAGCGKDGGNDTTTPATTKPEATTPAPETTTEPVTFNGRKFTISHDSYFPKKDEAGNFVSAVHEEWQAAYDELEARLDIVLELTTLEGNVLENLTSAGMSGLVLADLVRAHQREYWPAAKANLILAVDGDELKNAGLNAFDETRWYVPAVEQSKLFDKHWGLTVASKYIAVPSGYFVNFNKELVASAGDYDLYQLTRDKKWTWDVYRTIATAVTKDTTGDGVPDIWGTGATAWGNEAIANGVEFIGQDASGKWVSTINTPEGLRALQFLADINTNDGTRLDDKSGVVRQAFADGTIAFNWSQMGHINGPGQTIYESNHDYGIVPMPLGPDATEYVSMQDNNNLLVIQASNSSELETVVAIANEWALVVNDTENYLEVLDDGRCRTEADKEMMLNYILPNFKLNYAKMNDEIWDAVDEGIVSGVSYGGLTPSAAVEQFEPVVNAALNSFFGS